MTPNPDAVFIYYREFEGTRLAPLAMFKILNKDHKNYGLMFSERYLIDENLNVPKHPDYEEWKIPTIICPDCGKELERSFPYSDGINIGDLHWCLPCKKWFLNNFKSGKIELHEDQSGREYPERVKQQEEK